MEHITVLRKEAVAGLNLHPDSVVVDATFGSGGHSHEILQTLGQHGHLIAIDADPTAFADSTIKTTKTKAKITCVEANFVTIQSILSDQGIEAVDAILADLGWRTDQFNNYGKGFSFTDDTALTMTFGEPSQYPFTAFDIVNEWEEETLANIIYGYGEDRQARKIARHIVAARKIAPITSAKALADLIKNSVSAPKYNVRIHPATKTFQALRIAVNDELQVLETFISDAIKSLASHGHLAIISFHSLEDRIVKHSFRSFAHDQVAEIVTKKPIVPSTEELSTNPRARSAKLRIIKKL